MKCKKQVDPLLKIVKIPSAVWYRFFISLKNTRLVQGKGYICILRMATAKESRFYFDTGGLEYLNQFKLFSIFPAIKTVKTGYNYLNS